MSAFLPNMPMQSLMPDPKAKSDGLRPHKFKEGTYYFARRPYSDEVEMYEPDQSNYILSTSTARRSSVSS
jgi:hypothetical protein